MDTSVFPPTNEPIPSQLELQRLVHDCQPQLAEYYGESSRLGHGRGRGRGPRPERGRPGARGHSRGPRPERGQPDARDRPNPCGQPDARDRPNPRGQPDLRAQPDFHGRPHLPDSRGRDRPGPGQRPDRGSAAERAEAQHSPEVAASLEPAPKLVVSAAARYALPSPLEGRDDLAGERDARFAASSGELARAKSELDSIPDQSFDELMRALDLFRGLKPRLRKEVGMADVSNATLKMLELATLETLLGPEGQAPEEIRAFFNAELPGAFVMAAHHLMRTARPETAFHWLASSYYPRESWSAPQSGWADSALEDSFSLWREHRENWLMGPALDGREACDGDLRDPAVVCALANAVHEKYPPTAHWTSGATLYTSDAGVDVSSDYNRQEESTALLNFGQVVCGLLSLAKGGCLLTKMFTFFTPFSRSLIIRASMFFEETALVKPLTSRPSNSEVYLLGRGFRGITPGEGEELLSLLSDSRGAVPYPQSPLPGANPADYANMDAALCRAAEELSSRQVAFLREAADLYASHASSLSKLSSELKPVAERAQEAWLSTLQLRRILPCQRLVAPDRSGAAGGRGARGARGKRSERSRGQPSGGRGRGRGPPPRGGGR